MMGCDVIYFVRVCASGRDVLLLDKLCKYIKH